MWNKFILVFVQLSMCSKSVYKNKSAPVANKVVAQQIQLKHKEIVQQLHDKLSEAEADKAMIEERARVQRLVAEEAKKAYERDTGEEIVQMVNSKISSIRADQSLKKVMQAESLLTALDKEVYDNQIKINKLRIALIQSENELNNEKIKFISNFNNGRPNQDITPNPGTQSNKIEKEVTPVENVKTKLQKSNLDSFKSLNTAFFKNFSCIDNLVSSKHNTSDARSILNDMPGVLENINIEYTQNRSFTEVPVNRVSTTMNLANDVNDMLNKWRKKLIKDNVKRGTKSGGINNIYTLHNILNLMPNYKKTDENNLNAIQPNLNTSSNLYKDLLKRLDYKSANSGTLKPYNNWPAFHSPVDYNRLVGFIRNDIAILREPLDVRHVLTNLNHLNHILISNA